MQEARKELDYCLQQIEKKLGWGKGAEWTHQDFLNLSEKIQEETGEPLSYITLKRLWGKVAYSSFPNTNTLNTLSKFLGYDSWRAFLNDHKEKEKMPFPEIKTPGRKMKWAWNILGAGVITIVVLLLILSAKDRPNLNPDDFQFSSKKVVSRGIPNTVVFDITAKNSPYDSVIVQQSWDERRRTKISKDQSQHTSIYYFPGYFDAKLVIGDQIVQEHSLHITTDGWYCTVQNKNLPVPIYLPSEEINQNGRLEIREEQITSRNIPLQPVPPLTRMGNCRDFDGLMSDNFIFEATVRNTIKEGSGVCQHSRVYLLCQGNAIWVPLCARGCVSFASLNFINYHASGKKADLSVFGVDLSEDVHVKIRCIEGRASIFLNDQLVYYIKEKINPVAIKGIDFRFEGLGSIDDIRLGRPNGEWVLEENF